MSWNRLKSAILKSGEDNIGYEGRRKANKPWVTDQMLDKMEERRKWKNVNTENGRKMYRKLNNKLPRETDRARVSWWESQCSELGDLEGLGRSDLIYAKVKELCQDKHGGKKQDSVLSKDEILLTELDEVNKRRKEYIKELYAEDEKPDSIPMETEEEVETAIVLREEIIKAIHQLSDTKSEGVDEIPAEML